uniref:calcium-binding allergen Ole e 8-like n=1 Tax=Erigeron canadensis TaxID=72917 RepID=UPI001CB931E4|nr:calcium-binding allergen Ole e 8-like [Erigeron canadensis]
MDPESNNQHVFPTNNDEVKKIFNRFDTNGDGKISEDELANILKSLNPNTSPDEVKRIMSETDTNSDGFITLDEFIILCKGIAGESESESINDLKEAFKLYDLDNNGVISANELQQILSQLGENYTLESCANMIKSVDSDGDGFVDFEEFRKMMSKNSDG